MMIEIDGSIYSGGGTIVRYAVALSTVIGGPVHRVGVRTHLDGKTLTMDGMGIGPAADVNACSGGKSTDVDKGP